MTQPPENQPSKSDLLTARISLLFQDKRVRASVAIAILAIIALVTTLIVVSNTGDDDSASELSFSLSPETDYVFQPANSSGPDPFTPSFANYTISLETDSLESGEVSGASTGLYGGTGENACDIDKLIAFLQANPDIGAAWAEVQGITPEELEDFIRGLTPAVLLQNTLVTNHGYADGEAIPFLAVLEAGTAVLVDDEGIPRARCACGNPLLVPDEPEEGEDPTPTTEEDPTPTPPEEIPESACPEPNPPYGIHKNADDDWVLKTEEGSWVWRTAIPGWENIDDPSDVYDTEADVPGYIEECFPCPEEETPDDPNDNDKPDDPNENDNPNGEDDRTSSYEKDNNGKYKTSAYILNTFNNVRLSTYVVIKPITTNEKPKITPIEEDDTEDYDDNEYDDGGPYDKSYDGCFPPCPEDGEWGWDLFGPLGYTWVDPDGYRWYWTESGWMLFEPVPVDSSEDEDSEETDSSGTTYADYRDLPGWSEDCEECHPWGWTQNEDEEWEWHAPNGQIWTAGPGEDGLHWFPPGGGEEESIAITSMLPGYDEECEECPPWGWEEKADGKFVWIDPFNRAWFPQLDGTWYNAPEDSTRLSYQYLPGWNGKCHCEDQTWGWVDVNGDGIEEWYAPDGTVWAEFEGSWRPIGDIGDEYGEELSTAESGDIEITIYTRLPGWDGNCFEGPELTTEQPTPTPEPTPTAEPTPTFQPTPTPLPERPARASVSDTSCRGIWVSWSLSGEYSAPDSWNAYLTVESDLGTKTVMKSQTVPPINVSNLQFLATEFWPEMASGEWPWLGPNGAEYELVVYRVDGGVENSPSTLIAAVTGVFAGPNQCTGGGT